MGKALAMPVISLESKTHHILIHHYTFHSHRHMTILHETQTLTIPATSLFVPTLHTELNLPIFKTHIPWALKLSMGRTMASLEGVSLSNSPQYQFLGRFHMTRCICVSRIMEKTSFYYGKVTIKAWMREARSIRYLITSGR